MIDAAQHIGLVRWMVKRRGYSATHPWYEDLVAGGMVGLCDAASRYEETRGNFATYARWWIRREIQRQERDVLPVVGVKDSPTTRRERREGRPPRATLVYQGLSGA